MSIAQTLLDDFYSLERVETISGKVWINQDQLNDFRKKAFSLAIKKINDCPQSCDPSYDLFFEDGSKLYLANPYQEAFIAFAYTKE